MEKDQRQALIYTVDRIEEDVAVCQNASGEAVQVNAASLPEGVKEGSVLRLQADGTWVPDPQTEEATRARVRGKLNRLFGRK